MTIDRAARDVAVKVLQDLRSGQMLPDDFEDRWPSRASDLAVRSVGCWVWTHYDDDSTDPIRLESSEAETILRNAIEFLASGNAFEPRRRGWRYTVRTIFTLGVEWRNCELPWHLRWPFPHQ